MRVLNMNDTRIRTIISYFEKIDAGDPSYLDLFSDDVKFFFPKFGEKRGKAALIIFGQRMGGALAAIWHDIPNFNFIVSDEAIVVEGQEGGRMKEGTLWPDQKISQGRFCSVFEFSGLLISRMYIYVDPDFPSRDSERVSLLYQPEND